ncbi:hypothetical protein J18TS1_13450 [Oceanobacillus oncorhynchi subsp. incaldanensis]|uniref:Uncharacterized protein n=2 Tax=Oceanobacillus TaxID=182709 RepID=A0A0A1N0D9_9BACI|nr:DUF5325 family protein [Oceanobacillus oncorhynchi]MDM8100853.1 DUF5325 family protein [Oceanobacillus oncorhynchi]UUI38731.1 DUF5325 family protein [Oceanobacillus oncorhynchi]GIO18245.1 hypothetical protein J18TS1_13450 [Oceanobacillus oncorhynchi subsp. incaldanensis]CEI84431.1 hypothetical protein BN997_04379 [Oceanobacillus oncorhynchi]
MKKIDISMLLLAFLVVLLFILVGLAIAFRNVWAIILCIILAFSVFGFAMSRKKKRKG